MNDEKISLDLLGSRVLVLTAEVRDLKERFDVVMNRLSGLEIRFGALEARFSAFEARLTLFDERFDSLERRMSAMLAILVNIAERVGAKRE